MSSASNQDLDSKADSGVQDRINRYEYTKDMNERRKAKFDPLRTGIDTNNVGDEE